MCGFGVNYMSKRDMQIWGVVVWIGNWGWKKWQFYKHKEDPSSCSKGQVASMEWLTRWNLTEGHVRKRYGFFCSLRHLIIQSGHMA